MAQVSRLDFIGGSVCEPPLEQRRGSPVVLAGGGFLDTRAALPDLNADEIARYEAALGDAQDAAADQISAAREAWRSARMGDMVQRLQSEGVAEDAASERVERTLKYALGGVLLGDFALTLDNGRRVSVGEVLDDRERYHGALTLDPLEPEYLRGKVVGKLYLLDTSPRLYSFAHGGQTFSLRRQPARLLYTRGSAAALADEILARLAGEPDLFRYGGGLVRYDRDTGQIKPLQRAALLHVVGSRLAFYGVDKGGKQTPIEPPAAVIDMLGAI